MLWFLLPFFFCLFVQAFPVDIFAQLTPCQCPPHTRCSINIASPFFTLVLTCHPHPCQSLPPLVLSLAFLPVRLDQSKSPCFQTQAQEAKAGR